MINNKINADKSLGQHFIFDENITDKIVEFAGDLSDYDIFEVGPGYGTLTKSILKKNDIKSLTTIEFDKKFDSVHQKMIDCKSKYKQIIFADALYVDISNYTTNSKLKLIANLPYNIAGLLLNKWLRQNIFTSMIIMVQLEFAERLVASHNNKKYGAMSILAQNYYDIKFNLEVPPEAFTPPPKVKSAVITLTKRKSPVNNIDYDKLSSFLSLFFMHRRKKINNFLQRTNSFYLAKYIDINLRPENVDINTILNMATDYYSTNS
ncbi:MAG: 16S rRNA (adenine(1518)-N(6)/adenine(1519)-N(6))-dimethyltransferase RsmA [Anaplasmataceae bacterium]|nr:16S rRNA (adenine(1518)-N(6)/adenine(1519)-N(6))-dimethyltransferase RsmA [Candidatus Heimdallarchaeota archaeon]MDH5796051.1 16S rRNA (adenine(1518)-N(6)/adenine(1519)-N(6))-dimethyltransferase RsmA [Anaplasmataceae bacterium]